MNENEGIEGGASIEQNQEPVSQGAPDPAATPADPAAPAASPADPAAPVPAYTPSLKFKYPDPTSLDKHVQLDGEIDPFFQSLITDAESEKKVKELYEKAYGLDSLKPRYQKQAEAFRAVREEHTQLVGQIEDLRETYNRGDLDSFFQKLQIPEENILQWMVEKINYSKLPEEQRRVLDARKQAELEAQSAKKQVASTEERYQQQAVQHRQLELKISLQEPEVAEYAKAFDAARGPGAFRKEVCERGEYVYMKTHGETDLSPEQAIKDVMARYGAMSSAAQPAAPSVHGQQAGSAPKPTVIPNVGGRGAASPMQPRARSIEDLKKLANSM